MTRGINRQFAIDQSTERHILAYARPIGPFLEILMPAQLIICDTCAFSTEEKMFDGRTGGDILAELVEAIDTGEVEVHRHSCLMGCEHSCNIALKEEGKITYVLGNFRPTKDAAQGIAEYAQLYASSETGQVPFKQWPKAIKGHFIARIPALL